MIFNQIIIKYLKVILEIIKQEEEKAREELSKEVEAKENENLADGKLEIDDPIEKNDVDLKENLDDEKEKKREKNSNLKDIKFKK